VGGGGASLGGFHVGNCNKNGAGGGGAGGVSKITIYLSGGSTVMLYIGKGGQKHINNGDGFDTYIKWFNGNTVNISEPAKGGKHGVPYDSY
jgi:hypothetical protein